MSSRKERLSMRLTAFAVTDVISMMEDLVGLSTHLSLCIGYFFAVSFQT